MVTWGVWRVSGGPGGPGGRGPGGLGVLFLVFGTCGLAFPLVLALPFLAARKTCPACKGPTAIPFHG